MTDKGIADKYEMLLAMRDARIASLEAQLKTAGGMLDALRDRADAQVRCIAMLEARIRSAPTPAKGDEG